MARSITPVNYKICEPRLNIDLNQVCKGSSSILPNKNLSSKTDRKASVPLRATVSPFRINPNIDNSDISYKQKNIENLRHELQQRREMILNVKENMNRKQLEHKYWALISEIEETTNRITEIKKFNSQVRKEISMIQNNY